MGAAAPKSPLFDGAVKFSTDVILRRALEDFKTPATDDLGTPLLLQAYLKKISEFVHCFLALSTKEQNRIGSKDERKLHTYAANPTPAKHVYWRVNDLGLTIRDILKNLPTPASSSTNLAN